MKPAVRLLEDRTVIPGPGSVVRPALAHDRADSSSNVPAALGWMWRPGPPTLNVPIVLGSLAAVIACAVLATIAPVLVLALAALAVVVVIVMLHPPAAAYLLITLTPLVVGINRGAAIPVLRPNEALAVVLALALGTRALIGMRTGSRRRLQLNAVDAAILTYTAAASILPLLIMTLRHRGITSDDIAYALIPWKFVGVYIIVAASVKTAVQVKRCLMLCLGSAAVVAVVALLQVGHVGPVQRLLNQYYAPLGVVGSLATGRGSSTLGLPAATGDLLIYSLALAGALISLRIGRRRILICLAVLFGVGALATAEFSCMLGLLIAVLLICVVNRSYRFLLAAAGSGVLGYLLLHNTINSRLSGFSSAQGVPTSWSGRLHNLHTYFWPQLFSGWNPVLGVRLSARVPVTTQARQYVWIESGYTWLLWAGGIPLLLAFCYLLVRVLRTARSVAKGPPDAVTAVARTLMVAVGVVAVLMLFDPHVTYRGSADVFYMLMALLAVMRPANSTFPSRAPTPVQHRRED